jgi:hypothetical protein
VRLVLLVSRFVCDVALVDHIGRQTSSSRGPLANFRDELSISGIRIRRSIEDSLPCRLRTGASR